MLKEEIQSFLIQWNKKYPLDYYIRKLRGISFNSPEHRQLNLADECIDVIERSMYREVLDRHEAKEEYQKTREWFEGREDLDDRDQELFENLQF